MDLVSLLIMIIGIIILLGLYLMGRLYDQTPAKQSNREIKIPLYTDATGQQLSSVKADIPAKAATPATLTATDETLRSRPETAHSSGQADPADKHNSVDNSGSTVDTDKADSKTTTSEKTSPTPAKQHILFIATQTEEPLNGDTILASLQQLGFKLGDKSIYHYMLEDKPLFSVANGVEPWTLKDSDLIGRTTPGLSLIMKMPTVVDNVTAINTFVDMAEKLAASVNGELQNAQQQVFLPTDKELMLEASEGK